MKNFLKQNWFKMLAGTSMLIASIALFNLSITPATAQVTKDPDYFWVATENGIYQITQYYNGLPPTIHRGFSGKGVKE